MAEQTFDLIVIGGKVKKLANTKSEITDTFQRLTSEPLNMMP